MVKQALLSLFVIFVVATAAAPPQGKDKLNVCHFGDTGEAKLLSISRSALSAHLEHGDIEAPPSVRTSADCLIPQPPPEPVAKTATTDASGVASFVIPNTNIIARISAKDSAGAPVSGAITQIMVIGNDYLAMVTDPNRRVAPVSVEGKLTDAKPGSALQLLVNAVMKAFTSTFPNGSTLQALSSFPNFVRSHFSPDERCFTQAEYVTFVQNSCEATADTAVSIAGGHYFTLISEVYVEAAEQLASFITSDLCANSSSEAGTIMFSGKQLPLKIRVYNPPLLPGVKIFPVYFANLGNCGGACCDQAGVCTLVSDPARCTGRFLPLTPCNPKPCKVGACCNSASNCTVVTRAECEAIGGSYKGDDTTCSPDPCPFGACCNPKTGCTDMPAYLCSTLNGTFHGNGTTCTNVSPTKGPMVFNLTSGGGTGGASIPLPFTHGSIKTTVTVPPNTVGNQCNRNWRIEICVHRPGGRCEGAHIYAGQHFSICHTAPETVTFEQMNPPAACSHYSVNALTGGVSQVKVEVIPP